MLPCVVLGSDNSVGDEKYVQAHLSAKRANGLAEPSNGLASRYAGLGLGATPKSKPKLENPKPFGSSPYPIHIQSMHMVLYEHSMCPQIVQNDDICRLSYNSLLCIMHVQLLAPNVIKPDEESWEQVPMLFFDFVAVRFTRLQPSLPNINLMHEKIWAERRRKLNFMRTQLPDSEWVPRSILSPTSPQYWGELIMLSGIVSCGDGISPHPGVKHPGKKHKSVKPWGTRNMHKPVSRLPEQTGLPSRQAGLQADLPGLGLALH
ncbi:hypothetical protein DFH09DRAFT_1082563 [Mycena vulgaris]|nr:hypothetical protein DFH09DRAFT_1082563 [Mycena vulgaris]